jgi:hypothetical protein
MKTFTAVASAALLAACAHPAPVKDTMPRLPTVSIPKSLIASVCDQASTEEGSRGHFDGHAELLWSKDGSTIVAIACSLTVFVDGMTTTEAQVYLDDPRARRLRNFLDKVGQPSR